MVPRVRFQLRVLLEMINNALIKRYLSDALVLKPERSGYVAHVVQAGIFQPGYGATERVLIILQ